MTADSTLYLVSSRSVLVPQLVYPIHTTLKYKHLTPQCSGLGERTSIHSSDTHPIPRFMCMAPLMHVQGLLRRPRETRLVPLCICLQAVTNRPDEVAEYLTASQTLSEAKVLETTSGMEAYQQAAKDARIQGRENKQQYKQEQAAAMEGMSQN
ncbi:uncharacterized protein UBRO_21025 [Ustilago bromivora]|uniref:Uncharacterized protein n=1 Tax=Ustilago bromivora TaxID=307758 RepID=A0A1K0HMI4_9BASI|nr:uncharacterized protein UBRO_21025 [Ustilago bromivora]